MASRVPLGLLDLATGDLTSAHRLLVPGLYHNARYHAQQAGEKALRAFLLHEMATFPKTHDLSRLIDAIRSFQATFPDVSIESAVLNECAVDMRYDPQALADIDRDEAEAAIGYAQRILDYARRFLGESIPPQATRP